MSENPVCWFVPMFRTWHAPKRSTRRCSTSLSRSSIRPAWRCGSSRCRANNPALGALVKMWRACRPVATAPWRLLRQRGLCRGGRARRVSRRNRASGQVDRSIRLHRAGHRHRRQHDRPAFVTRERRQRAGGDCHCPGICRLMIRNITVYRRLPGYQKVGPERCKSVV